MQDQDIILQLAQTLYVHKAADITALKVAHLTILCVYMIIASGRTVSQVSALAEDVDEMMSKKGIVLRRTEGVREGRWVVLDYGNILVHLFQRDDRAFYNLDRLWNDGTNLIDLPFDQTISD